MSKDWTNFFSTNRENLRRVSVLVGHKVVNLTIEIAQHLSHRQPDPDLLGPEMFDARVSERRAP